MATRDEAAEDDDLEGGVWPLGGVSGGGVFSLEDEPRLPRLRWGFFGGRSGGVRWLWGRTFLNGFIVNYYVYRVGQKSRRILFSAGHPVCTVWRGKLHFAAESDVA